MSFNTNDNNQIIDLTNYEEYFILYMDNELSDVQMKMVDDFLVRHPFLQGEFDLLLGTKLPEEAFSFDKEVLLADRMKMNEVEDQLLLFIDNELPADEISKTKQQIASDKDFALQHQLLLKTKLDPSEVIAYPNKNELYRRSRNVVAFRTWLSAAAAVLIVAGMGILYWTSSDVSRPGQETVAVSTPASVPTILEGQKNSDSQDAQPNKEQSITLSPNKQTVNKDVTTTRTFVAPNGSKEQAIAQHVTSKNQESSTITPSGSEEATVFTLPPSTGSIEADIISNPVASVDLSKETINNSPVTSILPDRTTDVNASEETASRSSKGSFKGFLRKATRTFEKRTGFEPSSDDGEILIGALAVKVK
jgi:hypothetical protein